MSLPLSQVKTAAYDLLKVDDFLKTQILKQLAVELQNQTNRILEENAKDLKAFPKDHPNYDRLQLTASRIKDISADVFKVADLPSPLNRVLLNETLQNGLNLQKISVPLGVVSVIYEARPNVTVDVFSLCFKSGNACVLKGGKEAYYSNQVLISIIHEILQKNKISTEIVYLMPSAKEAVYELLNAVGLIDVCIPRGSRSLIQFVRENAKIPVIETGAGIVHTYFDVSGDLEKGRKIITNAKTRRVSVCNALDTLIIHEARLGDLSSLVAELAKKEVEIFADFQSFEALKNHYPEYLLKLAQESDFGREFLSYKMSIKTVPNPEAAIKHIMKYTSHHSEAIVAEEKAVIEQFLNSIDAGVVYVNASTAFTDGAQFGLGAEIGISTQKLHVRGPMSLEALTSYKWLVYGNGQVRE